MRYLDWYYFFKPIIPRSAQLAARQFLATYKRKSYKSVWPIDRKASDKPDGWTGWPENKVFALVLNHDVDTARGRNGAYRLMEIEKELGFQSSFNFVPEAYALPNDLRRSLTQEGFEIGVHGLRHDGKTFKNRMTFRKRAPRIKYYLNEWQSVGFTSPSMLRNHDFMAELDIEHGCSTFDTDPFEPESKGVQSIFPFYASNLAQTKIYVELPYTLPQDHCLYVILKEKDLRIWKQKLDWIAEKGGMALLNTHPDYMHFDEGPCSRETYPVNFYIDFLEYIRTKYQGLYWHALPREIARYYRKANPFPENRDNKLNPKQSAPDKPYAKIWIDLDNTPHVPFFVPVIRELERHGHRVVITARDAFQVCDLAIKRGLSFTKIGHHYGKNKIKKIFGLFKRSIQLYSFYRRERPQIALSHGARSQILLCNILRTPTVLIMDYEHSHAAPLSRPNWVIVPDILSNTRPLQKHYQMRYYPGIKEDVYVPDFVPDPLILRELSLNQDEINITIRPPAKEAHYYSPDSDLLFFELMKRIMQTPGTKAILLPRNQFQERFLKEKNADWFTSKKAFVPAHAVDGLNLLWHSDLVVSGGGTMNREAAALGIPAYSIFRGSAGAVDLWLEKEGRLTMIKSPEDVWTKIRIVKRAMPSTQGVRHMTTLNRLIYIIENIIETESAEI